MKRNRFLVIIMCCVMAFMTLATPISASEPLIENSNELLEIKGFEMNTQSSKDVIRITEEERVMNKMWDLQNKITKRLSIEGNHYIYNESLIKSLIYEFDFDEFNLTFNTNYNANNISDLFIEKISSYIVEPTTRSSSPAYTCGLSVRYGGWNYTRYYWTKEEARRESEQFAGVTDSEMVKTLVSGLLGLANPFMGFGTAAIFAWATDYSNNIRRVNYNDCGVVVDFNILTASLMYSEANQKDFPGHF